MCVSHLRHHERREDPALIALPAGSDRTGYFLSSIATLSLAAMSGDCCHLVHHLGVLPTSFVGIHLPG